VSASGNEGTFATSGPQRALARLLGWAERKGVALDGLDVHRPSLEDVFSSSPGRSRAISDAALVGRLSAYGLRGLARNPRVQSLQRAVAEPSLGTGLTGENAAVMAALGHRGPGDRGPRLSLGAPGPPRLTTPARPSLGLEPILRERAYRR
jgi:hypothetical protein